jgi:ABC-2 type transport system permease protein
MPDQQFRALVRLWLRQLRRSTIGWAFLFGLSAITVVSAYKAAYPTSADRKGLDILLGANPGFRALYGVAYRLDTPGGFSAWRVGGPLVVLAGVWALLSVSRILRGEEEIGRWELVLGMGPTARTVTVSALTAFGLCAALEWTVLTAAFLINGLAVGSSALLALGIIAGGSAFGAVAALTSQLTHSRRAAAGIAGVVLGVAFLVRVVADGTGRFGWLRWTTPLGWIEELRPFAGSHLLPLVPLLASIAALSVSAVTIAARRDLGQGVLTSSRPVRSHLRLMRSPDGMAWRLVRGGAAIWAVSLAAVTMVFGLLSKDVAQFYRESPGFTRFAERLGALKFVEASGFLSLALGFIAVAVAAYGASQVGALRDEEASGRLDHIVARTVSRVRWFAGRTGVVVIAGLMLGVAPAVGGWAGAALRGSGVGLGSMLVGGLNCLPVAWLFFGIGLLLFGTLPRLASGLSMGTIVGTFLLEIIGALARAPNWLLDLSPFHHVAAAPAAPVNAGAAVVMLLLGAVATAAGAAAFTGRDLTAG